MHNTFSLMKSHQPLTHSGVFTCSYQCHTPVISHNIIAISTNHILISPDSLLGALSTSGRKAVAIVATLPSSLLHRLICLLLFHKLINSINGENFQYVKFKAYQQVNSHKKTIHQPTSTHTRPPLLPPGAFNYTWLTQPHTYIVSFYHSFSLKLTCLFVLFFSLLVICVSGSCI